MDNQKNEEQKQQFITRNEISKQDPYYNSFFVLQTRFDLPKYYQALTPLGVGGFGVVVKAKNTITNELVAIKKILKPFVHYLKTKQILREIKILKNLRHDNIIQIKEVLNPLPKEFIEDIYIVSELMDTDLNQVIMSEQQLTEDHIQFIIYQLLCGLKYIHSAGVFHRDLKPSNILVNEDCEIKICDFGLARSYDDKQNSLLKMTEYVATRWYRAPELLLSWQQYDHKIDMWAIGCILSELFLRKPLFQGENHLNQIILIINLVGSPNSDDIDKIQSERAKKFLRDLGFRQRINFAQLIPNASPQAIDLISKLLQFNPAQRPSAIEALQHPFFQSIRDPSFEVKSTVKLDFKYEQQDLELNQLKDLIFDEIKSYHSDFDENNQKTYHLPVLKDQELNTLDMDGSYIYIDQFKSNQFLQFTQNQLLNIYQNLFQQNQQVDLQQEIMSDMINGNQENQKINNNQEQEYQMEQQQQMLNQQQQQMLNQQQQQMLNQQQQQMLNQQQLILQTQQQQQQQIYSNQIIQNISDNNYNQLQSQQSQNYVVQDQNNKEFQQFQD